MPEAKSSESVVERYNVLDAGAYNLASLERTMEAWRPLYASTIERSESRLDARYEHTGAKRLPGGTSRIWARTALLYRAMRTHT